MKQLQHMQPGRQDLHWRGKGEHPGANPAQRPGQRIAFKKGRQQGLRQPWQIVRIAKIRRGKHRQGLRHIKAAIRRGPGQHGG